MAKPGDLFVTQNETNAQVKTAKLAKELGLKVCYAAAPFEAAAVQALLPFLDFLILNEVEAAQLQSEIGLAPGDLPVEQVIVTLGSQGVRYFDTNKDEARHFPAFKVKPVDTTGAGDTFTGYVLSGMDRGLPMPQAIVQASRAAAIMVTRHGTADVIPDLKDVLEARLD